MLEQKQWSHWFLCVLPFSPWRVWSFRLNLGKFVKLFFLLALWLFVVVLLSELHERRRRWREEEWSISWKWDLFIFQISSFRYNGTSLLLNNVMVIICLFSMARLKACFVDNLIVMQHLWIVTNIRNRPDPSCKMQ